MIKFNEHEDIKNYLSKKEIDERKDLIKPIVFLDEETVITNSTPNTESLDLNLRRMDVILTAPDKSCLSGTSVAALPTAKIFELSSDCIDNTVYIVANKIANAAFLSLGSAIDKSYINSTGLLEYIPIRAILNKLLLEDIFEHDSFYQIIKNYYYGIINIRNLPRCEKKPDIFLSLVDKDTKTFTAHYAQNVALYIISKINNTIERTVIESVNKYNHCPLKEEFANLVKSIFKGIDKDQDGNFNTYTAYAICKAIYDEISICYPSIIDDITSTISNPDISSSALVYEAIITNVANDTIEKDGKNGKEKNKINEEIF